MATSFLKTLREKIFGGPEEGRTTEPGQREAAMTQTLREVPQDNNARQQHASCVQRSDLRADSVTLYKEAQEEVEKTLEVDVDHQGEQEVLRQEVETKVVEKQGTEEKAKAITVEKVENVRRSKVKTEKEKKMRVEKEKENKGKVGERVPGGSTRQKAGVDAPPLHKQKKSWRSVEVKAPSSSGSVTSSGHRKAERFYTLGQFAGAKFCNGAPPLSALPKTESFAHWLRRDPALTEMSDHLKSLLMVEDVPSTKPQQGHDAATAMRAMTDHLKFLLKVDDKT